MSSNNREVLILFVSTRAFLKARGVLQAASLPFDIKATPPDLSVECGMCISLHPSLLGQAQSLLPDSDELLYSIP